jgi:hypothetical protein
MSESTSRTALFRELLAASVENLKTESSFALDDDFAVQLAILSGTSIGVVH